MPRQITTAVNTSTGLQTVTIGGMTKTPLAAMVFLTNGTSDNVLQASGVFSFGAVDSSGSQMSSVVVSPDNLATSAASRRLINTFGIIYSDTTTQSRNISFDAFVSGGIRFDVATTDGNPVTATFVFFTDDDIISADVGIVALTTTPQTITTGNPTSAVITTSVGNGNSSNSTHSILSFGISTNEATDKNSGVFFWDRDGQPATSDGLYRSDTAAFGQVFNGSVTWTGGIGSYTATGFDVTTSGSVSSDEIGYLALEFKSGVEFSLFAEDGPAATGTLAFTQAHTTEFALMVPSNIEVIGSVDSTNADGLGVYIASADGTVSHSFSVEDTADPTNNKSLYSESRFKDLEAGSTTLTDGTLTTLGSLTFNFTTAPSTAKKWFGLSVGSSAGGTVAVTSTLGTITYTSQAAAVDLTGAVDVVTTLGTITYTSQSAVVDLTGSIDVVATLGGISYSSQNTVVDLTGSVDVSATLGAINYTSQNTVVSVGGEYVVQATLGAISYSSQSTTVQVSGVVDVAATLGAITYSGQGAVVSLAGLIDVAATLGTISYNSQNAVVALGAGQDFGTVTAGFADDLYSSTFKPDSITVTFKI
jgi:hypothetical protein